MEAVDWLEDSGETDGPISYAPLELIPGGLDIFGLVAPLIEAAGDSGVISLDQLRSFLDAAELDEAQSQLVLDQLDQLDIEITPDAVEGLYEPDPKTLKADGISDAARALLQQAGKFKLLTAHEEKLLARKIQNGDKEAKNEMVLRNIRLAASIAKKYRDNGLPMEDLLMEGITGLDRAALKFDPDRGYKFSTYATWWVTQAIDRAIDNTGRTIRIPVHVIERRQRLANAQQEFYQQKHRDPTLKEQALEAGLPYNQAEEARQAARVVESLNKPVGDDDNSAELVEFMADKTSQEVPLEAVNNLHRQALIEAMLTLSEDERAILSLHFGMLDGKEYSAAEVSQIVGVPKYKLHKLKKEALEKLASLEPLRNLILDEYFEAEPDPAPTQPPVLLTVDGQKVIFTAKEHRVMQELQKGLNYTQISKELNIKKTTAKSIGVQQVYIKINVSNKSQAVDKLKTIDLASYEVVAQ